MYEAMIPPFEIKEFDKMNKKEAQEHFDWYISQIPLRIKALDDYLSDRVGETIDLDFSYRSLETVWCLFEPSISTVAKTRDEIQAELMGAPSWLHKEIKESCQKISQITLFIAMDIAIYFAETFIRNNNGTFWGYYSSPKTRSSVNKPVVLGFKNGLEMDPRELLITGCRRSLRVKNPKYLSEMYDTWREFI